MKYSEIIRLTADHKTDAEIMTISNDGNLSTIMDSKAKPKAIHRDPMSKYIDIIIMKLPVINILAG
jgi:hypothetical protein